MSTSEKRLKEAFDAITMPSGLKESTMEKIDQQTYSAAPIPKRSAKPRSKFITRKLEFALAACLVLALVGFGGFSAYATETAVVGIDTNPSIQLGINRFDTVVAARASNAEGEQVLQSVSVVGKNSEEAIALITRSDAFLSYIDADSFVDIYVVSDNSRQSDELVSYGQESVNALPCHGSSNNVTAQEHKEAAEHGMGISRYEAAKVLVSLDPTLTIGECESMSMKELSTRIAELDPENEYVMHSGGGSGSSGGSGNGNQGQSQGQGMGQSQSQVTGQGQGMNQGQSHQHGHE